MSKQKIRRKNKNSNVFKKIKLKSYDNYISEGAHGLYFQISKSIGLKITHHDQLGYWEVNDYKQDAKEEFNTLKKAYERASNLVPKPLNLVVVEFEDNIYAVGYTMRHINGKTLANKKISEKKKENLIGNLYNKLCKKRIYHGDLHHENVMVTGNRCYAIDFDPSFVDFIYIPAKYRYW